jgi:hypothetical protein
MAYMSNIVRSERDPKILGAGPSSLGPGDRLARALGWFSLGLGISELIAPRLITHALGLDGPERIVRAYGAREIGAGVLTLSTEKRLGLWSRVAGDVLDIVTLVTALRRDNPKRGRAGLALGLVAGVAVLDLIGAQGTGTRRSRRSHAEGQYTERSGFPHGIQKARGAARDFKASPATEAARRHKAAAAPAG